MKQTNNENRLKVSLASINQYVDEGIVKPVEKEISGQEYIVFGEKNTYPQFLYSLYRESSTLQAVINSVVDYVGGNGVETDAIQFDDPDMLVREMALSYAIYGGFALNILRNRFGKIAQIIVLDFKYVRSNKDNTKFYYSEDFGGKYARKDKCLVYPAFDANDETQYTSIYYVKNTNTSNTYPIPLYSAAVNSAEAERQISMFHLNSIKNGFASNVLISMNAIPCDEEKAQIEEAINDKFTGSENASRPMVVFTPDKDHSVEVNKIDTDSFSDRYSALTKKVQQDILTAFRCNPNLMGIPTENLGFNSEEYDQTFKLFNRMTIKPIQNLIVRTMGKILPENEFKITPFNLE